MRLVVPLVIDYFAYVARPCASARRAARRRLLRLRRCLGSSHGSSSTYSPTLRVQVPRHVARLVVDYFASCRLVVDYFAYAARPRASARCAARRRLLRLVQARRQLLRLHRASGCLGMSRRSSLTTSLTSRVRVPRLAVDYFAYATRLGASARHAARRRLFRLVQARRRLLRLRRASGCLGTSRSSSRGSSSTTPCAVTSSCGHTGSTSTTPCVMTTCLAVTLALL
jgi:hypothetical protein